MSKTIGSGMLGASRADAADARPDSPDAQHARAKNI
jgi:hypothetical protein